MDVKQQKLLTKMVKATKSDMFIINPDGIIGTDKFMVTLTVINANTGICYPVEMTKDVYNELDKLLFCKTDIPDKEYNTTLRNNSIVRITASPIYNLYGSVVNNTNPCYLAKEIVDLKADPQFNEILTKKAADGNSLYHVDRNYTLSIFSGLLPINKNDKASLKIYDNGKSFIAEFIIDKGFATVNKYIQYLKI